MPGRFLYILFFLSLIQAVGFSQDKLRFEQLPVLTQTGFKQIIAKHHTGPVDYVTVNMEVKNSGLDLSKMSVEDAVMMLFMMMADDARKDMRDMLDEMNAARQKKAALRQAEELLKKELDSLKNLARNKYRADSLLLKNKLNEKTIKLQENSSLEKEAMSIENKATKDSAATEKHLRSVDEAIKKLQQKQSLLKQQ